MSKVKFKKGDKVQLLSGGSVMVVKKASWNFIDGHFVTCVWMDKIGVPHQREYKPKVLKKVK